MTSIFSKIASGEIPCYKIAETKDFFAFLDINPLAEGHTLVIPKKETDYIFALDDNLLAEMFVFAKKVAKAIEKNVPCKRIGLAVIGLEVPHAHIHLIPINKVSDIDFSRPKLTPSKERLNEIALKISSSVKF
ncbi:MAG: HIT family protein [Bacteroidetes bacterium CG02_land_8_20_14_3_00_31_25]|nr:HIT family protein [Bacteroidota bacterium]PIV58583.1 MAG: HIT family protein [Bacteroidetes bacterium CG02_land_8_20_14_3_00_31_25]PIX33706.1 MAG: HIT family protein [Bacteroidetes bacterium CG_4_8_14_3_um_filter_31_14]PIY02512.1 MAG: HIT family protein [Bacteroidetes bacterium CG_4_10_14_3_um_filter_31_20]